MHQDWTRHIGVGLRRVGDDEAVLVGRVLEVVINPLVFHQSADEGEVRFAVLGTVVAGGIGFRELPLHVQSRKDFA